MSQKVLGPGLFLFLLGTHHANPMARSLPYVSAPAPPKQHKALESQGHLLNHLVSPSAQSSHSALSPHGSAWPCRWGPASVLIGPDPWGLFPKGSSKE